jgi:hypothetical protein
MKTPERCCDNSEWPRDHDADCGNRTKPLVGTRTYAQRDQGMPYEMTETRPRAGEPPSCTGCSTLLGVVERLQKEIHDAELELLKRRHVIETKGVKVCNCRDMAEHIIGGCP